MWLEQPSRALPIRNEKVRLDLHDTLSSIRHDLVDVQVYTMKTGKHPDDAYDTPTFDDKAPVPRDLVYADWPS